MHSSAVAGIRDDTDSGHLTTGAMVSSDHIIYVIIVTQSP